MLKKFDSILIDAKIRKDRVVNHIAERLQNEDGITTMEVVIIVAFLAALAAAVTKILGSATSDKAEAAAALIGTADFNYK